MQPFNAPISDRKRQKFGVYMPRYEKESTMRPFDASISSYRRELFGEVMPRYETEPSMRPFDAPISDWKRELFGTYMRRYEEEPSMKPFDAAISERSRELYGEYMSRWSTRKVGEQTYGGLIGANGANWVSTDMPLSDINDESIYQVYLGMSGGWAGDGWFRIMIDGVKVYPFSTYETIQSYTWVSLRTLSTSVRTWETCSLDFMSTNAGDVGPGQKLMIYLGTAEHVLVP